MDVVPNFYEHRFRFYSPASDGGTSSIWHCIPPRAYDYLGQGAFVPKRCGHSFLYKSDLHATSPDATVGPKRPTPRCATRTTNTTHKDTAPAPDSCKTRAGAYFVTLYI
uniref:Uncharacterized protein n=1 Tax=Ornithodoros erraticus TaxID=265619 RepID=A0A293M7U6_ORNER